MCAPHHTNRKIMKNHKHKKNSHATYNKIQEYTKGMLKHRVTQTKSNPNMCANKCEYFFDTETNALFFRFS